MASALALSFAVAAGDNVWTGSGPENQEFNRITVAPTQPPSIYATFGTIYDDYGLVRSTDGGATWSRGDAGLPATRLETLERSPLSPSTLLLATQNGWFQSTDSGSSWAVRPGWPGTGRGVAFGVDQPAVWYMGGQKSTDGGESWADSTLFRNAYATAVDPTDVSKVYVVSSSSNGLYRSTDGASTWSASQVSFDVDFSDPSVRIEVDRLSTSTVFALSAGVSLKKSTDSGATWVGNLNAFSPAARSILPLPAATLVGTGAGVKRTTDSGMTATTIDGTETFQVRDLTEDPTDSSRWYAATAAGLLLDTGAGIDRLLPDVGVPMAGSHVAASSASAETVYLGTHSGMFKSTDDGQSWTQNSFVGHRTVSALHVLPGSPETILAGLGPTYRSTDGGESWSLNLLWGPREHAWSSSAPDTVYSLGGTYIISKTTDRGATWVELPYPTTSPIRSIAVHPSGKLYAIDDFILYSTIDDGASWQIAWVPYGTGYTTRVAVDPTDPLTVYVGFYDDGLWKTVNGGTSWTDVTPPVPRRYINSILVDPEHPTVVFVATDSGVFRSVNGGASWIDMNAGLTSPGQTLPVVQSLSRSPVDPQKFFAGTIAWGGGHAFRLTLPHGDANGDGVVDISDVFSLINVIFAHAPPPIGPADSNGDGVVDIADVFYLINYIFAHGPPPMLAASAT